MWKNHFKIAWRNLMRHKLYSFINLSGLVIGLAACLLIFLFVQEENSFDRFHEKIDRIYRVNSIDMEDGKAQQYSITSDPLGPSMAREFPEIEAYARLTTGNFLVRHQEKAFTERLHFVDPALLEIFSFPLLEGDAQTALDAPNTLVITQSTAKKYFGKTNVLNQSLLLEKDGKFESFKISGVAQDPPFNSSLRFEFLANLSVIREEEESPWLSNYVNNFVLLKPGASAERINAKFPALVKKYAQAELDLLAKELGIETEIQFTLQAYSEIHLSPEVGNGNGLEQASNTTYSWILSTIGLFILLIACINFTNLSLAQSLPRAREVGLRKVIGATRWQLAWQFLGEAWLLCTLALLMALLVAELFLPIFNELTGRQLSLKYLHNPWLPLVVVLLLFCTAFLAGFYPALVISRFEPVKALKGKLRLTRRLGFTKVLVVLQFALAAFLLIVLFGINRQMEYVESKDLGFNHHNLVRIRTAWGKGERLLKVFRDDLKNNPKVVHITGRSGGTHRSTLNVGEHEEDVVLSKIDQNFLKTLEVPLLVGRNLDPVKFPSDSTQAVLVNEAFVKKFKLKNPIGAVVTSNWSRDLKSKIVGVYADYHYRNLRNAIEPHILHLRPERPYSEIWVRVSPQDIQGTMQELKSTWRKYEPFRPFRAELVEIENRHYYEAEARWFSILTYSSGFAITISLMGLFGLATLSITQRTKEIGIRKVLGASIQSLIWLLSNQFNILVLLGVVIAIPLSYLAIYQWLQNFAYRTSISWEIFLLAGPGIFVVSFMAVAYQSIKIARGNPVDSLRYE